MEQNTDSVSSYTIIREKYKDDKLLAAPYGYDNFQVNLHTGLLERQ